ncbi:MAG: hypothetical protein ACRCYU_18690 [Nocardioides sp.]
MCAYQGEEIPCTTNSGLSPDGSAGGTGTWSNAQQCYVGDALDPQPDPPGGQTAADGTWRACYGPPQAPGFQWEWIANGEDTPPDPRVLAQQALDAMPLVKPTVHMAPQPPLMTYVGLETWLWMVENEWRDVTGSATAGATTVSVLAKPVRATWDLTTGTKECFSAGRAWVEGMSSSAQTDCSYTFQQVSDFEPDRSYPVTAVITYQVDWTCSGNCLMAGGTLGEVPGFVSDPTAIRVGERQSVVID